MKLIAAVVALGGFLPGVLSQTPIGFQPATEAKLGISYPDINITPTGTQVQSLDLVSSPPVINIPPSELVGPDGQLPPTRRFMVFMIDIDVVTNGTATTILHWFQPNLVPDTNKIAALIESNQLVNLQVASQTPPSSPPNPSKPQTNPSIQKPTSITLASTLLQQTIYLPPSPPPGPPHHYVLALFLQPSNFSVPACFANILSKPGTNALTDLQGRVGFDLVSFLAATGAPRLPIAANFFLAQNAQRGSLAVNVQTTSLRMNACRPASTKPAAVGTGAPRGPGLGPKNVVIGRV